MEDKIILTLIGTAVGLITAIVTSWLNKRAFREEIAESDILKAQLEDYKSIWGIVTKMNFECTQLLSWMGTQIAQMKKENIPKNQISSTLNKKFTPKSVEILTTVMSLSKYYVTIPASLIDALKSYETSIWRVLNLQKFDESNEILEKSEVVFRSIREITAELVKREVKISESVRDAPKGVIFPNILRRLLNNSPNHVPHRLTQDKRLFVSDGTQPNFCFTKTSYIPGTLDKTFTRENYNDHY